MATTRSGLASLKRCAMLFTVPTSPWPFWTSILRFVPSLKPLSASASMVPFRAASSAGCGDELRRCRASSSYPAGACATTEPRGGGQAPDAQRPGLGEAAGLAASAGLAAAAGLGRRCRRRCTGAGAARPRRGCRAASAPPGLAGRRRRGRRDGGRCGGAGGQDQRRDQASSTERREMRVIVLSNPSSKVAVDAGWR